MVEEGVQLMCKYCEKVTGPGTVGGIYADDCGNFCEIVWILGRSMPLLHIESGGMFAGIYIPCCTICGRDLRGGDAE